MKKDGLVLCFFLKKEKKPQQEQVNTRKTCMGMFADSSGFAAGCAIVLSQHITDNAVGFVRETLFKPNVFKEVIFPSSC